MKYKKYTYILVLLLTLVIGINRTYAEGNTCYYITSDKGTLVRYEKNKGQFTIEQRGRINVDSFRGEPLINYGKSKKDGETGITVDAITKGTCPEYIVYRHKTRWGPDSEGIWGFNGKSKANTFHTKSSQVKNMSSWLLSYRNEQGQEITSEEFYNQERENMKPSTSTGVGIGSNNVTGEKVNLECNDLFGSKDDPESLRSLINEILMYPKIIAPILLILFGSIDFAKAVISSKEDEMKKAQSTFVKRVIAGVAIFFVPLLVDLLMELADLVWAGTGYSSCGI